MAHDTSLDWSQFSERFGSDSSNPKHSDILPRSGVHKDELDSNEFSTHTSEALVNTRVPLPETSDEDFQLARALWEGCCELLAEQVADKAYQMWLAPLVVVANPHTEGTVLLNAPSKFIATWVQSKYSETIESLLEALSEGHFTRVAIGVDADASQIKTATASTAFVDESAASASQDEPRSAQIEVSDANRASTAADYLQLSSSENTHAFAGSELSPAPYQAMQHHTEPATATKGPADPWESHGSILDTSTHAYASQQDSSSVQWEEPAPAHHDFEHESSLDPALTFENYVEGKSNQMAVAAGQQVAQNPGSAYNPLFIYGGVGLGKTHLMHAIGNEIRKSKPNARVVYLNSERFVRDMVNALKLKATNEFKQYYRSVDALLIDDIQFFAKKEQSQEEFFHTFNALIEGGQQIILTCDRFPKEINGLEERLKSRFGWGLTQAIEPPELETRVAILKKKADLDKLTLSDESAFFIAQRIKSNVRELEGSLKRVAAFANFKRRPITVDLIREALHDLLSMQERLVTIENIQRVVADYYKIKLSDLSSKRRTRSVARPRQVAMYLAKELTTRSLPEVGDAFGGRDHTTVLHACKKIRQLIESDSDIREDVKNLSRTLSS